MIGSAVYDVQNRKIGKVCDMVLDRSGQIAAVVVDAGGFLSMGDKNIAVKPSDIKTDHNRLTLDVIKEQLRGRNFSYLDRQLKRFGGPNFRYLPINAPKCPLRTLQQDGQLPCDKTNRNCNL